MEQGLVVLASRLMSPSERESALRGETILSNPVLPSAGQRDYDAYFFKSLTLFILFQKLHLVKVKQGPPGQ